MWTNCEFKFSFLIEISFNNTQNLFTHLNYLSKPRKTIQRTQKTNLVWGKGINSLNSCLKISIEANFGTFHECLRWVPAIPACPFVWEATLYPAKYLVLFFSRHFELKITENTILKQHHCIRVDISLAVNNLKHLKCSRIY